MKRFVQRLIRKSRSWKQVHLKRENEASVQRHWPERDSGEKIKAAFKRTDQKPTGKRTDQ